jgi:hypothetical protein
MTKNGCGSCNAGTESDQDEWNIVGRKEGECVHKQGCSHFPPQRAPSRGDPIFNKSGNQMARSNNTDLSGTRFRMDPARNFPASPDFSGSEIRYSPEQRESHKKALNTGRVIVMEELKFSRDWVLAKLKHLMFSIDPRTQTPYSGFFESFEKIRRQKSPSAVDDDRLMVDGYELSREHFYRNYYFQAELVEYYWNLLMTETTYHPVKVKYYQNRPYLRIEYERKRYRVGQVAPQAESRLSKWTGEPPSVPNSFDRLPSSIEIDDSSSDESSV